MPILLASDDAAKTVTTVPPDLAALLDAALDKQPISPDIRQALESVLAAAWERLLTRPSVGAASRAPYRIPDQRRGIYDGAFYGMTVGSNEGLVIDTLNLVLPIDAAGTLWTKDDLAVYLQQQLPRALPAVIDRSAQIKRLIAIGQRATWSEESLIKSYRAAAPPGWPPPDAESMGLRFERMVLALADTVSRTRDRVLDFVRLLVKGAAPQDVQTELRRWIEDMASSEGELVVVPEGQRAVVEQPQKQEQITYPSLLVAFEPVDEDDLSKFRVRGWLKQASGRVEPLDRGTEDITVYPRGSLEERVMELYSRGLDLVTSQADEMTVEFFLPRGFLAEPVHALDIPLDARRRRHDRVGKRYVVVVRSWERGLTSDKFIKAARSLWHKKWQRLCQQGAFESSPIFKPETPDEFRHLYGALLGDEILCYVETIAPPDDIDLCETVFADFIEAGVPVGLWPSAKAMRTSDLYREIISLACDNALGDFPKLVRLKRVTSIGQSGDSDATHQIGDMLVLFWDDPSRIPDDPDHRYVTPLEDVG